jgi:hypothetical protein
VRISFPPAYFRRSTSNVNQKLLNKRKRVCPGPHNSLGFLEQAGKYMKVLNYKPYNHKLSKAMNGARDSVVG